MRVKEVLKILDTGTKEAADRGLSEIGGSKAITVNPKIISSRMRDGIKHATKKTGQNVLNAEAKNLTGNAEAGETVSGGTTDSRGNIVFNLREIILNHDTSETRRMMIEEAAHRSNRLNAITKGHPDLPEEIHEGIASHTSARQEGFTVVYPEHLAAFDKAVQRSGVSADQFAKWYLDGDNDKIMDAWESQLAPVQYSTELFNALLHKGMAQNNNTEYQIAA